MYCHIHHCHYHRCNCVPIDSKENGKALTQEELLAYTQEMKEELKDYTVDLKDQIFSYIDIGVNPVEINNSINNLKEQDTYILRTLTNKIDELNNTSNLSMFKLRNRVTDLEGQSATIIQDLSVLEGKTATNTLDLIDRTQRIEELETNTQVVESVSELATIENPKDGLRVYVRSYHAGLGKGGGFFTYDSSESSKDNGGVDINGWVREFEGAVTPLMFGARGDGVADDYPGISAAYNYAVSSKNLNLYLPPTSAHYRISQTLEIKSPMAISGGVGSAHVEIRPIGDHPVLTLNGAIDVSVNGLLFKGDDVRQGVGIYGMGSSRKIFIEKCEFTNLDVGVRGSSTWTYYIHMCNIHRCRIGVSFYRSYAAGPDGETTTVNIINNTIWANKEYNVAIGLSTEQGYTLGPQCTTLNIKDNMLDNITSYISGTYSANYEGNYAECHIDGPVLIISGLVHDARVSSIRVVGNRLRGGGGAITTGVLFDGSHIYNAEVSNNLINFVSVAIDASSLTHPNGNPITIRNNLVDGFPIFLPFAYTNKEFASYVQFTGLDLTAESGLFRLRSEEVPVSGRYKDGTELYIRGSRGGPHYIFESAYQGLSRIEEVSDTGDADVDANIVTPGDITLYHPGDRIRIPGANTGGTTSICNVTRVDLLNGTFRVNPSIKASVTGAAITFDRGSFVEVTQGQEDPAPIEP